MIGDGKSGASQAVGTVALREIDEQTQRRTVEGTLRRNGGVVLGACGTAAGLAPAMNGRKLPYVHRKARAPRY